MIEVRGFGVSKGISIGKAYVLTSETPKVEEYAIEDAASELDRLQKAVESAETQLEAIALGSKSNIPEDIKEVLEIQQMYLHDPEFLGAMEKHIASEKKNAEAAVMAVTEKNKREFDSVEDEYFRQRILDIQDLSARLLRNLMGLPDANLAHLPECSIIVARDLTPSDTLSMDIENVSGICLASNSKTSHTAIISRNLGIPAVLGIDVSMIRPDAPMIVDGYEGKIILDPGQAVLDEYRERLREDRSRQEESRRHACQPAATRDGKPIKVLANIGSLKEAQSALSSGADGVGLFRTEFLYFQKDTPPDEEEQYRVYRDVADVFNGKPVTIRTLDIGGDKQTAAIPLEKEDNPFLGVRAIRLCLEREDLFRTQLRALLRAGKGRNIRILIPMIGTLHELMQAREAVDEARDSLRKEQVPFADNIRIGMMIEVPSAAILADIFAREVDFFSIGTNDLSQYTLAADRTNEKVASLADPFDPAVLRLVRGTIDAGSRREIEVAMCGEMAGDTSAIPLLLGMGLSEFSMSPAAIAEAKERIRTQEMDVCKRLSGHCLAAESIEEVKAILSEVPLNAR